MPGSHHSLPVNPSNGLVFTEALKVIIHDIDPKADQVHIERFIQGAGVTCGQYVDFISKINRQGRKRTVQLRYNTQQEAQQAARELDQQVFMHKRITAKLDEKDRTPIRSGSLPSLVPMAAGAAIVDGSNRPDLSRPN